MMKRTLFLPTILGLLATGPVFAQAPFSGVADQVNKKVVKLYGSGGFRSLAGYGTGVLVSSDGYILTVASHLLDTQELPVHLYDGRRFYARVLVTEPELDAALLKIDKVDDLPYFDIAQAAKQPVAKAGDWVLAFTNQFQIATRDEPVSIQHGVVAAYSKLHGRRGIFDAPYTGEVYVLDAITNNPGAGGGALTTRKGELLGLVGKELRNTLTDTWMNYAMPVQARVEIRRGETVASVSLVEFVEKGIKGAYKPIVREKTEQGPGGFHGIVLMPDVIERTPPFIEEILPASPAARAGLKPDDLIVNIDGEQVVSVKAFKSLMSKARPGTQVKIEIRRADKQTNADKLLSVELKLEQPIVKKK